MRALLLCAGLGERLRPLTDSLAKAAVPLLNAPLGGYALRTLRDAGISEVAANLHHLPETVRRALGPSLRYVEEPRILGTGGAVRNLRDWLGLDAGPAVVANADTLAGIDLKRALAAHRGARGAATLVVEDLDPRPAFSAVWADAEGRLLGFGLEPPAAGARPYHSAGMHLLEPAFLRKLPEREAFCLHREGYLPFLKAGGEARIWAGALRVRDLGTPERYLAAHAELMEDPARAARLRGRPFPPERSPGVFVDADCELAADVRLHAPVLLEGVHAGPGSGIGPFVVAGPGTRLAARTRLARSVACAGAGTPEGFAGDGVVLLPPRGQAA